MHLKMKTCFKFLPVFFCLFFILAAPSCSSCGGSKNVAKQLQQLEKKGENHQDGNHDGGGSGGTTSTTTVTGDIGDINVSTTPVTGNNGSDNPPELPTLLNGQDLVVDSVALLKGAATIKSGDSVVICFKNGITNKSYTAIVPVFGSLGEAKAELLKHPSNPDIRIFKTDGGYIYCDCYLNRNPPYCSMVLTNTSLIEQHAGNVFNVLDPGSGNWYSNAFLCNTAGVREPGDFASGTLSDATGVNHNAPGLTNIKSIKQ